MRSNINVISTRNQHAQMSNPIKSLRKFNSLQLPYLVSKFHSMNSNLTKFLARVQAAYIT